jgi:outer membrane protein assembly factor BamB
MKRSKNNSLVQIRAEICNGPRSELADVWEAMLMKTSELIYVGIEGSVVALNRNTGQQVWATHLKGYDFVNVMVEDDKIFATAQGEVFCLDPATGDGLWHNRLKGFGIGLATIATGNGQGGPTVVMADKRRRDQEAAAS